MYLPAELYEALQYSTYAEVSNLISFSKMKLFMVKASGSAAVLGFS